MFLLKYVFVRKILAFFLFIFVWNKSKRRSFRNYLLNSYGCNNKIIVTSKNGVKEYEYYHVRGLEVVFQGSNNILEISDSTVFDGCVFYFCSNNSKIKIGKNSRFLSCRLALRDGNYLTAEFGDRIISNGFKLDLVENFSSFSVGDDCLFSNSISIWCSDGHSIYEKGTKNRINTVKNSVKIGNHCWIGEGVRLTKNSQIPDNTIVGMGSLVTSSFSETHTIIAGNPAKVVKRNVDWSEEI